MSRVLRTTSALFASSSQPFSVASRLPFSSVSSLRPFSFSCPTLSFSSSFSRSFSATANDKKEDGHAQSGVNYTEGEDVVLTGRQYELALLGNFPDTPTVQPFGTMDRPAMIYSGRDSRIVGCIGGGPYTHRLQWFTLKVGKKHVCSHCGQVFKLVNDENFEEVKDLVDARTREHYEFYSTLQVKPGQLPVAASVQVGKDSRY